MHSLHYGVFIVGLINRYMTTHETPDGTTVRRYHLCKDEATFYLKVECGGAEVKSFSGSFSTSKKTFVARWFSLTGKLQEQIGFETLLLAEKHAQMKYEEHVHISAPSECDPNTGLVPYFLRKARYGKFRSHTRGLDCREVPGREFDTEDEAMEHAKNNYESDLEKRVLYVSNQLLLYNTHSCGL